MTLLDAWMLRVARWRDGFGRKRTLLNVVGVLVGLMCTHGRRTVTNALVFFGRAHKPWSAVYRAFSSRHWDVRRLFEPVIEEAAARSVSMAPGLPIVIAVDDTSMKKTGKRIKQARFMRDPLSPPFHVNLRYGLRYLHLALVLPLHVFGVIPRAVSIVFDLAPSPKKPSKRATDDERAQFIEARKQMNLSMRFVAWMQRLRAMLDGLGHRDRAVLFVGDGSYTNRSVMRNVPERAHYVGRVRGDAKLFKPAVKAGRRIYGERLATPESIRTDEAIPYAVADLHYGGAPRAVK